MKIPAMGHVGLSVKDTQRSIEFYTDLLDMEVVLELDITDDRQARVIGVPGTQCKITHLKLGDGVLELFEYYQPERGTNKAKTLEQRDNGIVHIGFEVDNFHEKMQQLKDNGVKFVGEAVQFRQGVWVLYFYGPDGEVCELHDISKAK